jgi:lipopolysaccharide export system protein LptA
MRWQRLARWAIAVFVVVFALFVALALRRGKEPPPAVEAVQREQPGSMSEATGGGEYKYAEAGKTSFAMKWGGTHAAFADGRNTLTGGVTVEFEKDGRRFTVTSKEADIVVKDKAPKTARFTRDVRMTTADGLTMTTPGEATYDDVEGMVRVPGPVEFAKGRLTGRGVGATYDRTREVLWLLANAHLTVAPDATGGGAMEAQAKSAGLARPDHYVRLTGEARIDGEGRQLHADDIVIRLTEDDERVQMVEQRGNSRIEGGAGGPQSMAARDIDLTYAEDGRTLRSAKLMENSSVQLAGAGAKRVAGRTIDIALAPDGTTVTNLTSTERVQVDLPPDDDGPARRITSATLVASGAPEGGLRDATFAGGVVYRETRAAGRNVAAIDRTARSMTLATKTKPGFGAIEEADFRGNFTFSDGRTNAEAPHAVYQVGAGTIKLAPSKDPGPAPMVSDGKIEVRARTIAFTTTGHKLDAETDVRSSMQPQKKAPGGEPAKLPSLLQDDETVFVTSNRLAYDGAAAKAVYTGNATLWQGKDTSIRAETIELDDKEGNLTARGKVETRMMVEHEDSKTAQRKRVQQIGRAETFEYHDASRVATYTTSAYLSGPEGVVTAERIVLFLKQKVSELDRAEAYDRVTLREGIREVQGTKLVYTAATDQYVVTGPQVLIIETQPKCNEMWAKVAVYDRRAGTMNADGADASTKSNPCTGKRLH